MKIFPETHAALQNTKNRYAKQKRNNPENPLTHALYFAWRRAAEGDARMRAKYLKDAAILVQAQLANR